MKKFMKLLLLGLMLLFLSLSVSALNVSITEPDGSRFNDSTVLLETKTIGFHGNYKLTIIDVNIQQYPSIILSEKDYSIELSLADGEHFLVVTVEDSEGEDSDTVKITVDTTAPDIQVISPKELINVSEVLIELETNEKASCELSLNEDFVFGKGQEFKGNGFQHNFLLEGKTEGSYEYFVECLDLAGNSQKDSVEFTVDLTAPKASLIIHNGLGVVREGQNINFVVQAVKEKGLLALLYVGEKQIVLEYDELNNDFKANYTATANDNGSKIVKAVFLDLAGNETVLNTSPITFDAIELSFEITVIEEAERIKLVFNANEAVESLKAWVILPKEKEIFLETEQETSSRFYSSFILPENLEGSASIKFSAVDSHGFELNDSITNLFEVDSLKPSIVSITPSKNELVLLSEGEKVSVSLNFSEKTMISSLTFDKKDLNNALRGNYDFNQVIELRNLSEGKHELKFKARDSKGNEMEGITSFRVALKPETRKSQELNSKERLRSVNDSINPLGYFFMSNLAGIGFGLMIIALILSVYVARRFKKEGKGKKLSYDKGLLYNN
ncbi:MAG: hypothetical protein ABH821_04000 [archaeon]